MKILTIDIGGTNVKMLLKGEKEARKFPSGLTLTPTNMVAGVKELTADWNYDHISIGYPGVIKQGKIVTEPHNLASSWLDFDFEAAFGCPVKLINDAAMQALGNYNNGILLFLGLGTGLGSALVVHGKIAPLEIGHLPYKKSTYEGYVGKNGLNKHGKRKWNKRVNDIVRILTAALNPDDTVLGGGNAKKLKELPTGSRLGENSNAFIGGFRLWEME